VRPFVRCGAAALLVLSLVAEDPAQGAEGSAPPAALPLVQQDHAADRERLQRERTAINETLQRTRAACYQRFAVEDCLREARRKKREDLAVLRQQEAAMDDKERRQRAALRRNAIEAQQNRLMPELRPTIEPRASHSRISPEAVQPVEPRRSGADLARQQERRLAMQRRAEAERQRHMHKFQAAQAHKARVQQRRLQEEARGRKPKAPLNP